MSLPDNAHPECKELGMCVLREYKGYMPCNECSGSCSMADSQAIIDAAATATKNALSEQAKP